MQKVGVEKSAVIIKSAGVIECGKSRLLDRPGCIRENASISEYLRYVNENGEKIAIKMTDAGMSPKCQLLPVTSYPTSSKHHMYYPKTKFEIHLTFILSKEQKTPMTSYEGRMNTT